MRESVLALLLSFFLAFPLFGEVLRFPSLSPDGKQVAFTYRGDIWSYGLEEGRAQRVTDNEAFEGYAAFSPDGEWIAFSSKRSGNYDVYVVSAQGGIPRRLTFHSGDDLVTGWGADGKEILFQSNRKNMNGLYRVPFEGGGARPLWKEFWMVSSWGREAPDGKSLVFNTSSEAYAYWWREGYRGSNGADLWLYRKEKGSFLKLTEDQGNDLFPAWAADGKSLYYSAHPKGECQNLFRISAQGGKPEKITSFTSGTLRWVTSASRAPRVVFEHDHKLWLYDASTGETKPLPILLPSDTKGPDLFRTKVSKLDGFSLSPDNRKLLLLARGRLYLSDKEGKLVTPLTEGGSRAEDPLWDRDSQRIYYLSDKEGEVHLFAMDPLAPEKEERLTKSPLLRQTLKISPDGRYLSFVAAKKRLTLLDLKTKNERVLVEAQLSGLQGADYSWSPDSKRIYYTFTPYWEGDLAVVDVATAQVTLLTKNPFSESEPVLSPDGKRLYFAGNYEGHSFPDRSGQSDLFFLPLSPEREVFPEELIGKLFQKEEKKDGSKEPLFAIPLPLSPERAEKERVRITSTVDRNESLPLPAPDGKRVAFVKEGDELCLLTFGPDNKVEKVETLASNIAVDSYCWDSQGEALWILSRGGLIRFNLGDRSRKPVPFSLPFEVERKREYRQVFREVWRTLRDFYYDSNFHGTSWEKVRQEYEPLVESSWTEEDFYLTLNEMLGTLNSSHLRVTAPPAPVVEEENSGAMGATLLWDSEKGLYRLDQILKDGPLDKALEGKAPEGSLWVVAFDGKPLVGNEDPEKHLLGRSERRVLVTLRDGVGKERVLAVKAGSVLQDLMLLYNGWEEGCRERVHRLSEGRLGYLHMKNMGWDDWLRFSRELEMEMEGREGIILDLRYNNGGNVHDQVLNTLIKRVYSTWKMRDYGMVTQPTYAIGPRPVTLLINEASLSDAEMTANGFKELKLGALVGETTYGWLIFTSGRSLLNGGFFRIPYWGCYTLSGQDLETHGGVVPDYRVPLTPDQIVAGSDPQLEKAVEVTLAKLKGK